MTATTLAFTVTGTGEELRIDDFDLVVAGYTGRDEASVRAHIEELAAIGVPEPESVPAFYPMGPELATQSGEITVSGTYTSGEVEPVLVRHGGRLFLGVGSDHTDRDLERDSVARSKEVCPKPVSAAVVELPDDGSGFDWDTVRLECTVDGVVYQRGTLEALRVPTEVLALRDAAVPAERSLVMLCGTLPLLDGTFVAGTSWSLTLRTPDGTELRHAYTAGTRVAA
ncbi:hypothetical protein GCM10018793_43720 [Streptomyces sulfonofaciens]|uniref:DUF2848 domain-containing protein n=1 Tax=Streptomyces sulfonofaciens TaxID=68272 RepID=A0A919GEI4_9ACTN|nr:DUF2848 family protein [Streptomyces sulfonofaciens]GHH82924.1 hypothetical protein GCM10018793_43720 [Streptomyces sulfonofaciens]